MPTFTAIALENLLEPRVRESFKKPDPEDPNPGNGRSRHLYISPALYATPEQAPIPEYSSPDPPSPSPYVANHKRRAGCHARVPDQTEVFGADEIAENFVNEDVDGVADENEGFLDPRSEVASALDAADLSLVQCESRSFVSAQGEFFDANDEFSSDGSISNAPSHEHKIKSELHALRLSLLDEIEKRETAEGTLFFMLSQWVKIRILMLEAGLAFPPPPVIGDNMQLEDQVMQQMSQARAEAEEVASAIVESKDLEILRLRDRLQYYETVNHEMSQRKLVEVARRQKERKSRRKWLWSLMGLAVAVGASLASYTYISYNSDCESLLESVNSADSSVVLSEKN